MTDQELNEAAKQFGDAAFRAGQDNRKMLDDEINEAVAKKLGYPIMDGGSNSAAICTDFDKGVPVRCIPDYCHSIAAAWEIVDYLNSKGFDVCLSRYLSLSENRWQFCFYSMKEAAEKNLDNWINAQADTAPMAIAQAFLKLP